MARRVALLVVFECWIVVNQQFIHLSSLANGVKLKAGACGIRLFPAAIFRSSKFSLAVNFGETHIYFVAL